MYRQFGRVPVTGIALAIGLLAFVSIAPGSNQALAQGQQTTVTKTLRPFTSIQINGGGQATLTFGAEPSVTIEGNSLIVERLDADVVNGELTLGSALTSAIDVTGLSELKYTIVTPSIEEIHLAGTVNLTVSEMPAQPFLELGMTTGANLTIGSMDVESLTGKMDLLSKAKLVGSATTLKMEINNGSELDATDLQVGSADLVLNGVAKATVRVTDSLTGRAAQGSTVHYISETVTPDMTLTTMAAVYQLEYTAWTPPAGYATPMATPVA